MPIANIICSICTEVFNNSDDVHSTTCGHLFHLSCLSSWQMRQKNCPQCRLQNPTTHKLHLSFDESEEIPETTENVDIKLVSANEKIIELQDQVKQHQTEFLQLQKQFTLMEKSNLELEEKISTINDMENDFMQLQAQYTESSELKKDLEDQINQLFIRNECKAQELKYKSSRNVSEKDKFHSMHAPATGGVLNEKINFLEQKIKHILHEFDKEIKQRAELSTENMKLQSRVNSLQNPLGKIENEPTMKNSKENVTQNGVKFKNVTVTQNKHKTNSNRQSEKFKTNTTQTTEKFETNTTQKSEKLKRSAPQNSEKANYLVIKQFPMNQLTEPLENVIILLSSKMKLQISTDDLIGVSLVTNKNKMSNKAQIVVEFKSSEMKNSFLLNTKTLKKDAIFQSICIEDLHELYLYAKKILETHGYKVFYKNHKIFANKNNTSRAEIIHIQSKTQVDNIENSNFVNITGISPKEFSALKLT